MTNQRKGARGKRLWLGPVVYAGMACMLGSCSAMRVDLGTRVELDKVQVAKIEAKLLSGPGIAPGQRIPLVVTVTEPNGAVLQTEGKGGLITVRYDPTVTPYLKLIHVSSRNGPAPLYHQESVAAVW